MKLFGKIDFESELEKTKERRASRRAEFEQEQERRKQESESRLASLDRRVAAWDKVKPVEPRGFGSFSSYGKVPGEDTDTGRVLKYLQEKVATGRQGSTEAYEHLIRSFQNEGRNRASAEKRLNGIYKRLEDAGFISISKPESGGASEGLV